MIEDGLQVRPGAGDEDADAQAHCSRVAWVFPIQFVTMARRIDLSSLSPAERAVSLSGGVLFVNGFIPWWYRIPTPGRTYFHNAGLTGLGLLAVLSGFIAALAVLLRRRPMHGLRVDWLLYMVLGSTALVALGVQARRLPEGWIGYWIALAMAIVMIFAGLRRARERRRGWV